MICSTLRLLAAVAVMACLWPAGTVFAREVVLGADDVRRFGSGPLVAPDIRALPADPALPVIDPAVTGNAAILLKRLVSRGVSQGFGGILYENRDRGHSSLPESLFPNLTFLKYDDTLKEQWRDYGPADEVLIPALLFGNSSTAHTGGAEARSLSRSAMTQPGKAALAFRNYESNSIYIYPEHRDHDAVDLYPGNWPYQIISQGSSGSDLPFMKAVAMTLAAFPGDTRAALELGGLIAPTVQMILRRNLSPVRSREGYLSPAAHPTVFDAKWPQPARMVSQAAAMRPEDIAPMVKLRVLEDGFLRQAGLAGLDEHLYTTPSAIARVWRDIAWEREITVSASPTEDPNGRDLVFEWVILRGDPERIRIEPLDPEGRAARITLAWHDEFTLPPLSLDDSVLRRSSRVDIGVFAWNGRTESAPAFLSVSFPAHQARVYEPAPDGTLRIASIDYDAQGRGAAYDPLLHWSAGWSDRFTYAADGSPAGWTRTQGGSSTRFGPGGRSEGAAITYMLDRGDSGWTVLQEVRDTGN